MKKICFVVYSLDIGGVEKSLITLLKTYSAEEYEITVVVMDERGELITSLPTNARVIAAKTYKTEKQLINGSWRSGINRLLQQGRFFDAFIYGFLAIYCKIYNNLFPLYRYLFRTESVIDEYFDEAHAYAGPSTMIDFFCLEKIQAASKSGWIHYDISKFNFSYCSTLKAHRLYDNIYCVSSQALENYKSLFPEYSSKSILRPNIIDKENIKLLAEEPIFCDDFRDIKILTVGRLSPEKGQDLALRAASILKQKDIKFKWYFIGDGIMLKHLKQYVNDYSLSENIAFLGRKINPYPYMKKCDIYVQPSVHEGFCITVAEALCFNKPIVCTDFCGAREQLIDVRDSIIVPHDDNHLAEAIYEIAERITDM